MHSCGNPNCKPLSKQERLEMRVDSRPTVQKLLDALDAADCQSSDAFQLFDLAKRLRIRVEQPRERLDMQKFIHLEMLLPHLDGEKWVSISSENLEKI